MEKNTKEALEHVALLGYIRALEHAIEIKDIILIACPDCNGEGRIQEGKICSNCCGYGLIPGRRICKHCGN